jgi:hypothetical protein
MTTDPAALFEGYRQEFLAYLRSRQAELLAQEPEEEVSRAAIRRNERAERLEQSFHLKKHGNNLADVVAWLENLSLEDLLNETSYSAIRGQLDAIYAFDLLDVFAGTRQENRFERMEAQPHQLLKWRFLMSIRNLRSDLGWDEDAIDLHGAIGWQLANHERGVDTIDFARKDRMRINAAIHSQYVVEYIDRVFKMALLSDSLSFEEAFGLLENDEGRKEKDRSATVTFEQALGEYLQKFSGDKTTEEQNIRMLRRRLTEQALVHDYPELPGELSVATDRNAMTVEQAIAYQRSVEEQERVDLQNEMTWHVAALSAERAGLLTPDTYEEKLREHIKHVHDAYTASRHLKRFEKTYALLQREGEVIGEIPEKRRLTTAHTAKRDRLTAAHAAAVAQLAADRDAIEALGAPENPAIAAHAQAIFHAYHDFDTNPFFHAFIKALEHGQNEKDVIGNRVRITHDPSLQIPLTPKKYAELFKSLPDGQFPLVVFGDLLRGDFNFNYMFGDLRKLLEMCQAGTIEDDFTRRLIAAGTVYTLKTAAKFNRPNINPDNYVLLKTRAEALSVQGQTLLTAAVTDEELARLRSQGFSLRQDVTADQLVRVNAQRLSEQITILAKEVWSGLNGQDIALAALTGLHISANYR